MKRVIIGLVALLIIAGGGAWLLHVSIDPAEEAATTSAQGTSQVSKVSASVQDVGIFKLKPVAR